MVEVHCKMLCLLVAMTLPRSARASDVIQAQYKRNSVMDGMQLTTAALFQTSARSTLHCGIQCSLLDGCISYTYTGGQPSSCRGYNFTMTSPNATDSAMPAAGAKTFEKIIALVDECSSNPCQNGGTCIDQVNGYLCQCAGYAGQLCQTALGCAFDTDICAWTQDTTDDFDWTRKSGSTPSDDTGPTADHTSGRGYYVFIETSTRSEHDTARLLSPQMDGSARCLTFWFHMYGSSLGNLNVYLRSGPSQPLGTPVFTRSGPSSQSWVLANLDISSPAPLQVVIEATRGSWRRGDIAIDDISVADGVCTTA